MIYQLRNVLLIPKILDLAKALDTDPKALETALIRSLGRKDAILFVDEKDGVLDGFILATVEEFESKDAAFIQSCVVQPTTNEKNVCHELLARVRRWAADQGITEMYFMTKRNHKAFQRKYNFRYHATVLKRRV
jgi:N-acetylglutamate synthase-like GNAT family acetyltransferase